MRRPLIGASCVIGLRWGAVPASAVTPFEQDVATSIDRGLAWLVSAGAFAGSAGWATGLDLLAPLEKRASGNPVDPAQGYTGANAPDQGRAETAVHHIIGTPVPGTSSCAYGDGSSLMALLL